MDAAARTVLTGGDPSAKTWEAHHMSVQHKPVSISNDHTASTAPTQRHRARRRFLAAALTAAVGAAMVHPGAEATPPPGCRMRAGTAQTITVSSVMGTIPVQVRWARHCGSASLYVLDGMRARSDVNGWVAQTDAPAMFADDDVTLVMPVGGPGSWYADWVGPTLDQGRPVTYRWETFLTRELPKTLADYGVSATGNAVVGLSMSASTAVTLAAHHRDQFVAAAAFSGVLDWHTPDMSAAVRAATWQAGHNPDELALPGSPEWDHLDPYTAAPLLTGATLYIAAGSGVPGPADQVDSLSAAGTVLGGIGLEAITAVATRRFKDRLDELGIPAIYSFPPTGTHNWPTWNAELGRARPYLLAAIGVEGSTPPP
ncbi:alpha/beta hydrolase (plasmid) [Nocardia sp. CA-084685]|uniref:alpha/beta hydrolase n=1 Tax=Nocardia sp. CA-084685 TaxID=3239970 RepID=UPI003D97105F